VTVEDVNANDLVAFFVEVVAFIALAVFAWRAAPTGVRSWVWMRDPDRRRFPLGALRLTAGDF